MIPHDMHSRCCLSIRLIQWRSAGLGAKLKALYRGIFSSHIDSNATISNSACLHKISVDMFMLELSYLHIGQSSTIQCKIMQCAMFPRDI